MVSLKMQKRLAASVMKCGQRKVWLDPNEVNEISMANSRESPRLFMVLMHQKINGTPRALFPFSVLPRLSGPGASAPDGRTSSRNGGVGIRIATVQLRSCN